MRLFAPRLADGQSVDVGGLSVRLKVNGRARRISLRVDRLRREAIAIAPSARQLDAALAFARERRAWLAERLADALGDAPGLAAGDRITVLGLAWRLHPDGRRPRLVEDPSLGGGALVLRGCGLGEIDPQLVVRAVRREALAAFMARAEIHCGALGASRPPLSLMDARTRWGSCTPAQHGRPASMRLSWRLALAPFEVADYVVAHECAHLVEANHGPRFWALVRALVGDARPHRAWLRQHGPGLHALLPRA